MGFGVLLVAVLCTHRPAGSSLRIAGSQTVAVFHGMGIGGEEPLIAVETPPDTMPCPEGFKEIAPQHSHEADIVASRHQHRQVAARVFHGQILHGHIGHGHPAPGILKGRLLGKVAVENSRVVSPCAVFTVMESLGEGKHGFLIRLQGKAKMGKGWKQPGQQSPVQIFVRNLVGELAVFLRLNQRVGGLHSVGSKATLHQIPESCHVDIGEGLVLCHQFQ